jgi:hypothetical protein
MNGPENLTNVGGELFIYENPSLTSISGLSNLTSVGGDLGIWSNDSLASLTGLQSLINVGGFLGIGYNSVLTNLCALYNVSYIGGSLTVYYNMSLSMSTAFALRTQLRSNGFTGDSTIRSNDGSVQPICESDNDLIIDSVDNCPSICNTNQLDADGDGIGDVCDTEPGCGGCGQSACEISCDLDNDAILNTDDNCPLNPNPGQEDADNDNIGDSCDSDSAYGVILGDVNPGHTVSIFKITCGNKILADTTTTDFKRYYSFGNLPDGSYEIVPSDPFYVIDFVPVKHFPVIPQTEIQSYDFTATLISP